MDAALLLESLEAYRCAVYVRSIVGCDAYGAGSITALWHHYCFSLVVSAGAPRCSFLVPLLHKEFAVGMRVTAVSST